MSNNIVRLKAYLRDNLLAGLLTSPLHAPLRAWVPVPVYAVFALALGLASDLFRYEVVDTPLAPLLPFTLLVFPSLLEEAFFRGVLIPRDTAAWGPGRTAWVIGASTLAFVLWHPLNALTVNRAAAPIFLDPAFLAMTAALGATCGYGYVVSRSLWVPVLIHWATVVVWVLLLGGRNRVLAL